MVLGEIGFVNCGNSCYAAAVMQCMLHCPVLVNAILNRDNVIGPISKGMASCAWQKWSPSFSGHHGDLSSLIRSVCQSSGTMTGGMQHDAHEFMATLIHLLEVEAEVNDEVKVEVNDDVEDEVKVTRTRTQEISKILKDLDRHWRRAMRAFCASSAPLHGQTIIVKRCSVCDHVSYNFDVFMTFPVYQNTITEEIQDQRRKVEIVDDYKCDKCARVGTTRKEVKISKTPLVLVAHVMRFNGNVKDKRPFSLEETISIASMLLRETNSRRNHMRYTLVAIACHNGSQQHSGHYYAVCKFEGTGKWMLFDDDTTQPCRLTDIPLSDPYMLFYCHTVGDNNPE